MTVKLNMRQRAALKQIVEWNGHYSKFWTQKSNEYLAEHGLVNIGSEHVFPTDAGRALYKELKL